MIRCCFFLVGVLVLPASSHVSSPQEYGVLRANQAKKVDAEAVAQASRNWDRYWDDLDAAGGGFFNKSTWLPSYQALRVSFPAAVQAFGIRCGKRERMPRRFRESVAWFPDSEKLALVRAAVRHYAAGDPDTPFLSTLARVGTAEDMKRLQGYIRQHPDSSFPASYMLECENPYAHVALAEMIDVPGRWRDSAAVRTFLAELEKARPPRYVEMQWIGLILVTLPASIWLSARGRQMPRYRRESAGQVT